MRLLTLYYILLHMRNYNKRLHRRRHCYRPSATNDNILPESVHLSLDREAAQTFSSTDIPPVPETGSSRKKPMHQKMVFEEDARILVTIAVSIRGNRIFEDDDFQTSCLCFLGMKNRKWALDAVLDKVSVC